MAKMQLGKRGRRVLRTVLRLPDLDQAKPAVLNSFSSSDAQRGYRHAIEEFIEWYCSEPRLSVSKTVFLRYRMQLESRHLAPGCLQQLPFWAALAFPLGLNAQISGDAQITILQTTDLHDHANGSDHVGLDVDTTTGMGATGAYARISAYVNYVRAGAGHPVILVDSGDWSMGTLYDLALASRPLAFPFSTSCAMTASR